MVTCTRTNRKQGRHIWKVYLARFESTVDNSSTDKLKAVANDLSNPANIWRLQGTSWKVLKKSSPQQFVVFQGTLKTKTSSRCLGNQKNGYCEGILSISNKYKSLSDDSISNKSISEKSKVNSRQTK